jgi:hypothetical protein
MRSHSLLPLARHVANEPLARPNMHILFAAAAAAHCLGFLTRSLSRPEFGSSGPNNALAAPVSMANHVLLI